MFSAYSNKLMFVHKTTFYLLFLHASSDELQSYYNMLPTKSAIYSFGTDEIVFRPWKQTVSTCHHARFTLKIIRTRITYLSTSSVVTDMW